MNDGQIVEQGTHKELLEKNGIFARMWADQVNADRRAQSLSVEAPKENSLGLIIDDISPQALAPVGYDVEPAIVPEIVTEATADATDTVLSTGTLVDEPGAMAESIRGSIAAEVEDVQAPEATPQEEPETQPSADPEAAVESVEPERGPEEAEAAPKSYAAAAAAAPEQPTESTTEQKEAESAKPVPIAFPTSGDAASSKRSSVVATPTGITFSPEVDSPPSRSGTPDPDAEPKRKRISSQNFQRLAKRITMVRRNSSSASMELPADSSTSTLETPGGNGTSKPQGKNKNKLKRKGSAK